MYSKCAYHIQLTQLVIEPDKHNESYYYVIVTKYYSSGEEINANKRRISITLPLEDQRDILTRT